MKPTNKLLLMSEAAAPFFEDHKFEKGDCFGARNHTCDNETFWKNTFGHKSNWKSIMLYGAGELTHGICTDDSNPNYTLNCGHESYTGIFPVFRADEIFEMLQDNAKESWVWNISKPIDMMLAIAGRANITKQAYFSNFKSFEEFLLAFFMFVVHQLVWYDDRKKWEEAL